MDDLSSRVGSRISSLGDRQATCQLDWNLKALDAEELWREHGWGLDGTAMAVVVGTVLLASCLVQLVG